MVFVPIAIATLILASLVRVNAKKKKVSPERTAKQQTDELVTVILPIINKGS